MRAKTRVVTPPWVEVIEPSDYGALVPAGSHPPAVPPRGGALDTYRVIDGEWREVGGNGSGARRLLLGVVAALALAVIVGLAVAVAEALPLIALYAPVAVIFAVGAAVVLTVGFKVLEAVAWLIGALFGGDGC